MALENLKIAKGSLTDNIFAGYIDRGGERWRKKIDVTNMFLAAVIQRWAGFSEIIESGSKRYKITVEEL